jgi:hypothetical protein
MPPLPSPSSSRSKNGRKESSQVNDNAKANTEKIKQLQQVKKMKLRKENTVDIGKIYQALYKYDGKNKDELSFLAGSRVKISNKGFGDGWVVGTIANSDKEGFVPECFLGNTVLMVSGQAFDTKVCVSTDFDGNEIILDDWVTLQKGSPISDNIINFMIKRCHARLKKNKQDFLVIGTEQAQQLAFEDGIYIVAGILIDNNIGSSNGPQMIIIPFCENGHFFLFVVCVKTKNFFVLDSIGTYESPQAATTLKKTIEDACLDQELKLVKPVLSRQVKGSNNCGLCVIEYAEKIMHNPEEFVRRGIQGDIGDWINIAEIEDMRFKTAELFKEMGINQRNRGGELDGSHIIWPQLKF